MSWGIGFVGKAHVVAAKVREAATKYPCAEPEESIRQQALDTVAKTCESLPKDIAVQIRASGSMSTSDGAVVSQTLAVDVQTLYGFVE